MKLLAFALRKVVSPGEPLCALSLLANDDVAIVVVWLAHFVVVVFGKNVVSC